MGRGPGPAPIPNIDFTLSPESLNFYQTQGGAPSSQNLVIDSFDEPIGFTVSKDVPWLNVSQTTGTTPSTMTVSVNGAGLAAGTYQGNLTVVADDSSIATPIAVSVTLTVEQSTSGVSLSASPSSQSINAGQSGSYLINIGRTNFSGTVDLAVSGLPAGVTAMFSADASMGNSSTLTINTSMSTPSGARTLTISGTAPGVTIAPVTVNLTVNPPISSLSLSASPTAQSITAGVNASYNIMLKRTNFTGGVNLAVGGLPKGATAGFTLNPAAGTNSMLIVSTSVSTPPGSYILTISGTAPSVTIAPVTVNLTVNVPKGKEKEGGKEVKEKERKEKEIDGKDFTEFPFPSSEVVPPTERLSRLEGAVGQLIHFIPQDLRPSLEASALKGEPDLGNTDPATLSRQLQKQASDAKQAKDIKDMEKLREA